MWQAPPKAGAAAKRRDKYKQRIPLHIRRVPADLRIIPADPATTSTVTPIAARVLMNDLSLTGAGIFLASHLPPNLEVEISFENPKDLVIRGKVIWCQEQFIDSHIVSQNAFSHRAGIQFKFKDAEEETKVKKLYENFAREILYGESA